MSRTLVICTLTGLVVSATALGAAVMIGGDDIFHDPNSMQAVKPLIDLATRKEWRWNGGDTLAMDAPINIRYQPSSGPRQVSVTGPAEVIRHVRVDDGRIATDSRMGRRNARKVEAVVSGVPIRKFVINNGENLDLGELKQPDLDLHINGPGRITGSGEVERLNLVISGPGSAGLGGLSVTDEARVAILGNGTAALAPKGELRLFIAGNGRLEMTSKPRNIRQTIVGNGELREAHVGQVTAERAAMDVVRQNMPPTPPAPPLSSIENATGLATQAATEAATQAAMSVGNGDFTVAGSRSVDFGHIEQPRVKINVMHSGSATAEGQVNRLNVAVMGSGNANLGMLRANRAEVVIGGSGTATVAVSGRLKVTILGSGNVRLMTRPAEIEQTILGSGKIIAYDK
jgi:hypothetical protein